MATLPRTAGASQGGFCYHVLNRGNGRRPVFDKKGEYMALGISEYWIIDRFRRIMTVYRNQPGEIGEITIKESEAYESALLPGFEAQLQPLLRLADQLVQPDLT